MKRSEPRLGQPVHYRARGSADGVFPPVCRAAIVTDVLDDHNINAVVLNPTGLFFHTEPLGQSENHEPGTWHYPCPPGEETLPSLKVVEDES